MACIHGKGLRIGGKKEGNVGNKRKIHVANGLGAKSEYTFARQSCAPELTSCTALLVHTQAGRTVICEQFAF